MGKEATEIKTCRSCKFWDLDCAGDRRSQIEFKGYPHGQCLKALLKSYDYDGHSDGKQFDEPMLTLDGSQYMAILMTRPDHCCTAYENRGSAP